MEKKIYEWVESVKAQGCTVNSVTILNEIRKYDNTLLFALIDANVHDPSGHKLPNIVFIRGHACVIVPQIINTESKESAFLMVRQRRIGSGADSLEFPAGMLDNESNDPTGVAIKEMLEETGLQITRESLFPLCNNILYSTVGGSDEGIYYFGCSITVDNKEFHSLNKRISGNLAENERITVELISRDDAEAQARSTQVLLGFYLFDKYIKDFTK